jgi:hypothetical protein
MRRIAQKCELILMAFFFTLSPLNMYEKIYPIYSFSGMIELELKAIYLYLQSLAPFYRKNEN